MDYETGGDFQAFRKGEENWIVTEDEEFYTSYVKATEGAKALNLLNKEDRIKLFVAVNAAGRNPIPRPAAIFEIWDGREADF